MLDDSLGTIREYIEDQEFHREILQDWIARYWDIPSINRKWSIDSLYRDLDIIEANIASAKNALKA